MYTAVDCGSDSATPGTMPLYVRLIQEAVQISGESEEFISPTYLGPGRGKYEGYSFTEEYKHYTAACSDGMAWLVPETLLGEITINQALINLGVA